MDKAGRINISAWKWHLRARKKLVAARQFDLLEWKGAIPAALQPVTSQQLC